MLFDNILDLFLLEVLKLILLQEDSDLSTATKRRAFSVESDRERSSSGRFPDVLLVVVVLRHDLDALGNEV